MGSLFTIVQKENDMIFVFVSPLSHCRFLQAYICTFFASKIILILVSVCNGECQITLIQQIYEETDTFFSFIKSFFLTVDVGKYAYVFII